MAARTKASVLAWLDARGWSHDPKEQTKEQNALMRAELKVCGAQTSAKTPCTKPPGESGRCDLHGNKSPKGIASPHYIHGRYSRYQPERLMPAARRALEDPDLISLDRDLVDVEARIDELKHRLDEAGDPGEMWPRLQGLWAAFWQALGRNDRTAMDRARGEIDGILRQGSHESSTWAELLELYDARRKLVIAESRRRKDERTTMSAEQAARKHMALALAVKKHVKDPEVLSAIAEEFIRLDGAFALPGAQALDAETEV